LLSKFEDSVHGMVHITGGGFYENVPRMYAKGKNLVSVIKKDSWEKPAIFEELIKRGADPEGVWGTFNMGIGFVMAVSADKADAIIAHINENAPKFETEAYKNAGAAPLKAYKIGHVEAADKDLGEDLKGSHEATKLI